MALPIAFLAVLAIAVKKATKAHTRTYPQEAVMLPATEQLLQPAPSPSPPPPPPQCDGQRLVGGDAAVEIDS
uniref:Secreted protein n=1 Tax=Oryza meridionalis TaxID=40149 RepID=A0A0E0E9L5_9ORYZ